MTVIVTMILYIFGLDASTGTVNYKCKDSKDNNIHIDKEGNVKIYDPYYDSKHKPVYFKYPNVIVPNPPSHPYVYHSYNHSSMSPPPQNYSSSPMFQ
jgi:hypothetical protein